MKNIIQTTFSIFIFLVICNSYGQKNYKFDKIVNNTFSTKYIPNQKHTNLFNTEDDSYHMQIYYSNDSLVSRIFDTKENIVHYFYIDKADSLKLKFIKTKSLKKFVKDYKFEFSEIKENKGSKEVIFKILNNRDKRIAKYKLKIKETEKKLFSIFKLSSLETLLFTEIIPSKNFLILKAKGINTNGKFVEYKLDSIEDINLNVELPE
ncbi:hypothetical protein [Lutibacter maritimus]|uniref:Uncharacterized protein n=1 Tax=Lutibacter maritimus TaxID=593133 RepID=A0A1I6NTA9_9FLAO|nr:hypothetical protein [Lutibacter maritimus]SFS31256.1 hypothetical protein SAMN04488006_0547 [Lutibacter maritimus]